MAHSELYIGSLTTPDFYFSDGDLLSATGSVSVDLMSDELVADTMEHAVNFDKVAENMQAFSPKDFDAIYDADYEIIATSYTGTADLTTVAYGTAVWYYYDSVLIGKFYTQKIVRVSANKYEITLMSCIGLLTNLQDNGGIFTIAGGDTFRSVLAGILGGTCAAEPVNGQYAITGGVFDCFVEQQAGVLPIAGWLPIDTKRNNLHQLLFSESVALTKSADGTPVFSHIYTQTTPETLAAGNIYLDGAINYGDPATAVNVTEHTYLNLGTADELVTLFDGSAEGTVTNAKVEFTEPCHGSDKSNPYTSWVITGNLTVHSATCNYAVISGSGTLQGYKYTHSTKLLRREVSSPSGKTNEKTISSVTLINPTNSANVADRAMDYYAKAKTVDADAKVSAGNPKAGRQYSFTDPFGEASTGFVTQIEFSASNILKASCHIITDYTPTGQGNNYSNAVLLTSGNWTVPTGITKARAILIGGGTGGTAGNDGEDGEQCTVTSSGQIDTTTATGGDGGTAGDPGTAGYVNTINLTGLTAGTSLAITYGAGGASGGGTGGNTTLTVNGTTYSSNGAGGQIPAGGVVNLFTGAIYAQTGKTGYAGAGGGTYNADGGSLTVGGVVYAGGSAGDTYTDFTTGTGFWIREQWTGGGGGGAAYGRAGGDGHPTEDGDESGDGGNGANASAPSAATYGSGGAAGNGGGGGAGGGYKQTQYWIQGSGVTTEYTAESAGSGGNGSAGGVGGAGCVLIYY